MKRLTTLCAAVLMAAMSFAEVKYDLQGAVTNDYGWMSKADICLDLQTDYNAAYSTSKAWAKLEDGVVYYQIGIEQVGTEEIPVWKTETEAQGSACDVKGFLQNVTFNETDNLLKLVTETNKDKYAWLSEYIVANRVSQGLSAAMSEALYRKELSAFFLCSPANSGWPGSSAFTTTGDYNAFAATWKHGFDNPTEVAEGETWTLNAPYREGETFRGWFDNKEGTGTPITEITSDTQGTLYAVFGEYIPSIKEVRAMGENTLTKVHGIVTYVGGKNVYIADGGVGILVYLDNSYDELDGWKDLKVSDNIVVEGTYKLDNTFPRMEDNSLVSAVAGTEVAVTTGKTLADVVANAHDLYGTPVEVKGVNISKYDSDGNAFVKDGINEIQCYYMTPDPTSFPVGAKVTITAVVANSEENVQFVGNTEDIVAAAAALRDETEYPVRGAEEDFAGYTLKNEWIFANTYDNYSENLPGPTDNVRGMAVKDGIMYFVNRSTASFTRVNGATGEKLDDLSITGEHLFQEETVGDDGVTSWKDCATLPYNDVKVDNAGNLLIGGCISGGNRFQIYKVDENTGAATEVVNDKVYDQLDKMYEQGMDTVGVKGYRFDAFGVYGDVDNDAIIMACSANGWHAFRWTITGGKWDGNLEVINLLPDPAVPSLVYGDDGGWKTANPGTAPQIFPLEGGFFYIDGWSTFPMLFDAGTVNRFGGVNAYLLEDFASVPTGVEVTNNEGETCTMKEGHNGLAEFQVGDEYFLLMAATNTDGSPQSSFALYKYKDVAKSFKEIEPLWFFPANGMGGATNGCRTAVPSVEVNGTEATIYLYTNNNGYAVYTFTGKEGSGNTGVENVVEESFNKAQKVLENGVIYIYRNGVRYNVMGAQVK